MLSTTFRSWQISWRSLTRWRQQLSARRHLLEILAVAGYLMVVAIVLMRMCALRPVWFDELFTLQLARDPLHLWQNLCAGVDNNPPLSYLLSSACIWLMGESLLTMRLPAVLGALAAVLSLYLFVRDRRGVPEAMLAAASIGITSPIWIYFVEARPYGPLMGITAVSLLCWQRRWHLSFALSLSLGMLTHYYFILPVLALAAGECVRGRNHRAIDRKMLLGFLLAGVTLLALSPHWRNASRQYALGFWAKVKFSRVSVEDSYQALATKDLTLPVLASIALASVAGVQRNRVPLSPIYSSAEMAVVVVLALGPLIGVWLGAKVTGAFFYRYAVPATLGWSVLFAFVIGQVSGSARWVCTVSAIGFALSGVAAQWKAGPEFFRFESAALEETASRLDAHAANATVLFASPFEFTRIWQHQPNRSFQPCYLADPDAAYRHNKVDTVERGLQALQPLAALPLMRFPEMLEKLDQGATILYSGPLEHWQVKEMHERAVQLHPTAVPTLHRLSR